MVDPKKIYFTAGPAKIPDEVMQQVREELLDYNCMGISVMEMSHRSKQFGAIRDEAEANLRKLVNIPDNYAVLFMHGGAKNQFDAVPMNLCPQLGFGRAEYLINGTWSKMAAKEAEKHTTVVKQELKSEKYTRQPAADELTEFDVNYRYYCDNETIQGVEFNYVPEYQVTEPQPPLVTDMTSNFISRPIDVSKFGVIFAGAQKNCGMAGLCIVIVRKDLIGKHMPNTPSISCYKTMEDNKSMANTPPMFAIYIANLCFKWALANGGLETMDEISRKKSAILYDLIDNSGGFYTNPVEKSSRSRMNVVFLLKNTDLEPKFLEEAQAANLFDIKGHRSVGGFRASLYHGITVEDTNRLASFMRAFQGKYSA